MSLLFIGVLLILRKVKKQTIINASIVFFISIYADIGVRSPIFSIVVSICGLFYYISNKSKNKLAVYILLSAAPVCISSGMVIQEVTLYRAENLKNMLLLCDNVQDLKRRFFEYCHSSQNEYCGFSGYRIFLISNENVESSYLIAWKFFGRQQIIPLNINKHGYESDIGD
jgi:hypothetical protein